MIIFPAIDILGGKCVRLTEGRFDAETVFADNPVDMAVRWTGEGAEFLHLVDLDGARAGRPVNLEVVSAIVKAVHIPVQLGGGIRTMDSIAKMLELGVYRVILGSIAVQQPELVKEAVGKYGERIVVGIDARDGQAAVEGWGVTGGVGADVLAKEMAAVGVARIIYTDISRDGTLTGVNITDTGELARSAGIPVIASGGVSGIGDIIALKVSKAEGIEGVIVGKSIYTGALDLKTAISVAREEVV